VAGGADLAVDLEASAEPVVVNLKFGYLN
jgi:hypothetical protein